ncbi:response regulator [Mucilaginibacter sp. UR6-11]|uniref:response regulator n=1 Tax=Mucilaginibacter sp. UR6-11 TaxID=1435644 RepID=UPI001E4D924A|nr:response regulator [Mucilaginibacter sp. UR6-11]MCC8426839.1 response regulator [Mucilaginibacter sp. UR6-11]
MELSFIVIDDTELDHFIARKMITNANSAFHVRSFMDASQALEHIMVDGHDDSIKVVLLFLDIYMPLMNGFQFVEAFEKLDQAIQDKYYIVALTSSIEISDINRISSYHSFRARITKPITADELKELLNKVIDEYGISM